MLGALAASPQLCLSTRGTSFTSFQLCNVDVPKGFDSCVSISVLQVVGSWGVLFFGTLLYQFFCSPLKFLSIVNIVLVIPTCSTSWCNNICVSLVKVPLRAYKRAPKNFSQLKCSFSSKGFIMPPLHCAFSPRYGRWFISSLFSFFSPYLFS